MAMARSRLRGWVLKRGWWIIRMYPATLGPVLATAVSTALLIAEATLWSALVYACGYFWTLGAQRAKHRLLSPLLAGACLNLLVNA